MWQSNSLQNNELRHETRSTGETLIIHKIVPANCCRNHEQEMAMVQIVVYVYGNPKFPSYTKKKILTLKERARADQFFDEEKNKIEQKYQISRSIANVQNQSPHPQVYPSRVTASTASSFVNRNINLPVKKPCGCGGNKRH